MNGWLLDPTLFPKQRGSNRRGVVAWLRAHKGQCFLSTISLAELSYGWNGSPMGKRRPGTKKTFTFWRRIIRAGFSSLTGTRRGSGDAMPQNWNRTLAAIGDDQHDYRDTLIAAIGREYGLTVATRNEKHFPFCQTENPFGS